MYVHIFFNRPCLDRTKQAISMKIVCNPHDLQGRIHWAGGVGGPLPRISEGYAFGAKGCREKPRNHNFGERTNKKCWIMLFHLFIFTLFIVIKSKIVCLYLNK